MKIEGQQFYFIGIGGIGMSALARYFHQRGGMVAGYDRNISEITKRLQAEGIAIQYVDDADIIPFPHRDKEQTLMVYTPAIPSDNAILNYFQTEGFNCMKRAELLGELSKEFKTIAVAGTHGKTTISTMIAFLLHKEGVKLNAFLGGISRDFGTNIILNPKAGWMVTEADEYDRSFLQLKPQILVISSVDSDHFDIYEDREDLINTYGQLVQQIQPGGTLICKPSVKAELQQYLPQKVMTYDLEEEADIQADKIRLENGNLIFDYVSEQGTIRDIRCGLPGKHNIENALAAILVTSIFKLDAEQVKSNISEFHGIKRRFDVHLRNERLIYIDDYAHHPEEIKALIESVRLLYPKMEITTIFQPHLYSRTRDFVGDFAEALALSDELILLEIYPAREEPIEGVDSLWLSRKIKKGNVPVCQKHQLINILKERNPEVLLTVGAGDIDTLIDPIINHMESRL